MKKPNENGVYEPEKVEQLARRGRAVASVKVAQCLDGLYRFALDMHYSYGGFCSPITDRGAGHSSAQAAIDAGTEQLLRRFPKPWASEPQSVHDELRDLKAMIEDRHRQPSLF